MNKIFLPSVLTENTHFYKGNEKKLEKYLGKFYISYSAVSSWFEYKENFIKEKIVGIKLPTGIYAQLGSFIGEAIENGKFGDNPNGFCGLENIDLNKIRPKNAEYEKLIVVDRGEYIIVGFIDIYHEEKGKAHIQDVKTGGKNKEISYESPEYIQVMLYAHALEEAGKKIGETSVLFIRREGSHFKPPLCLTGEMFVIPLEYTKERVKYSLDKVDKAVNEISEIYTLYTKLFK